MPLFVFFTIDHIGSVFKVAKVLSEMVGIFEYKFNGSVSSEPSNSKVKPVFSIGIKADIGVSLELDGDGVVSGEGGST